MNMKLKINRVICNVHVNDHNIFCIVLFIPILSRTIFELKYIHTMFNGPVIILCIIGCIGVSQNICNTLYDFENLENKTYR